MKDSFTIDNWGDRYLDSRDIIARKEELENDYDSLIFDVAHADKDDKELLQEYLDEWAEDYLDELEALQDICSQGEGYGDWGYGTQLIRDYEFENYAKEVARDCGYMDNKTCDNWPYNCIDWEEAAEQLQQDYSSIEAKGCTYWMLD